MWGDGAGTGAGGARFRALVVDDEPPLVQVVSGYLSREGFDVVTAADGETAVALARDSDPDVVVLDLMLPGIDGMEVCRRIRAFSDAYIIMLTAKSDEVDKLVGLSVGADDYLTKPFSPRELVARVRAMLRRPRGADPAAGLRRFGALEIDPAGREVRLAGRRVELTRTEFDVLDALSAQPGVGRRLVRRRARHRRARRQRAPQARRRRRRAALHPDRARGRLPDGRRLMAAARGRGRLATRLFATQALIVIAGAVTLVVVAVVVAPGLFRDHLQRAVGPVPPDLAHHLDQALAQALLLSLGIAVAAALATTLAVSWFVTRRLTRPIAATAAAATRIAGGDYDTRVPPSRLGVEFGLLDNAFNRMAATLHGTERRRRELLADLAHELRTPLATLDSFLEGIEDGVIPATPDTWHTLREQTTRMRRLVDDVDAVSRAEERHLNLQPHPVDINDFVPGAVRAAAAAFADKAIDLQHRPSPTPAHATADADRIREILDNLLANALRHTPAGGTVTVTALAHARNLDVTVSDTGEGITAEHLPQVFDRFYRADPARSRATGGSGIGLTIARALARAHHGDLTAASDGTGHGATFTLTLPRH